MKVMEIKPSPNENTELNLEIFDETFTLGEYLVDELLKNKSCTYAAFNVRHPLDKKMILKFCTNDPNQKPIDIFLETLRKMEFQLESLMDQFENEEYKN